MRILVTGGSSFVGAHFCRLASQDHSVVALYNRTPVALNGVTVLRRDLLSPRDVDTLPSIRADAVVHLACRIKVPGRADPEAAAVEVNRGMLEAVLGLGLPTVYCSSTVVHWNQDSPYAQSRREEELRVRQHEQPWAIVRPCAPYGPRLVSHVPRHRESFHTLASLVRNLPVVPVPGDGQYRRQPVHVDDFNGAILALLKSRLPCKAYDAGGPVPLTFDQVIDTIAEVMSTRVQKLHVPKSLFVQMSHLGSGFAPQIMATVDSDDVVDVEPLRRATGIDPRPFAQGARCLR